MTTERRQSPRRIVRQPSGALLDLDALRAMLAGWDRDAEARRPKVRRLSASMPELQIEGRR